MKRTVITLSLGLFTMQHAPAQFLPGVPSVVFDPTNHGVNLSNLAQLETILQTLSQYSSLFASSQGMFRCPTCFLSAAGSATNAVIGILSNSGAIDLTDPNTANNVANLRKVLTLGTQAMSEVQIAKAMSTGNGANVSLLMIQMAQVAQQINATTLLLQRESDIGNYMGRNVYTPQGSTIANWRLK